MLAPTVETLRPIREIADRLSIPDDCLESYGRYTAKLSLDLLSRPMRQTPGKLILVTAITPTIHGEGKTVTAIGLSQAIDRLGRTAVATIREPSVGPVFGQKGGATGGGRSQVLPSEKINLQFTGDFPSITAAHNLIAAQIDAHLLFGNELNLEPTAISWPRALDMNDRALRNIIVGLGGKSNGTPRETGFIITAASEIMAILALATSRQDLRKRLEAIIIGYDRDRNPVRAGDLKITGALMVLLNEALMPNLVQTTEGTPATVHCGPFANIAHGTSSVLSHKIAQGLAEYVVNECGFAADLGAEKYFDIVMPQTGIKPAAAVLVASFRALCAQGATSDGTVSYNLDGLSRGFANLDKHIENLRKFGAPVVVAINRFPDDTDEQIEWIASHCRDLGVESAPSEVFAKGGAGAVELAELVCAAADGSDLSQVRPLYQAGEISLAAKVETVAREIYGAGAVEFSSTARAKLSRFEKLGFRHLPVCVAKTQASITDNPKLPGAPRGWTLSITDASLSAGAGFVVVIAGNMMLMPGLPKVPQAMKMDVDDETGEITGLR